MHSGFVPPIPFFGDRKIPIRRQVVQATATSPATTARRRLENAEGNFYVDSSCIDCDTCRWLAPKTFTVAGNQAAVHTQPLSKESQTQALRALLSCPTGSIRTQTPVPLVQEAIAGFPMPVTGTLCSTPVPDIFFNGFTSKETYGCASWLLVHRGASPYAVMFDCPRFYRPLAKAIKRTAEPVGGVKYIVLSHLDDVAQHGEWAAALGAERIIHEEECTEWQRTDECEIKLSTKDFPYSLADGSELLHLPGHTVGSIALLHRPSESLFLGDHLAYVPRLEHLAATTKFCKNSWKRQIETVERMKDIPFLHGWPGHYRHFHFKDAEDRRNKIAKAAEFMRGLHCERA